jgi:hypothetical protein
MPVYLSDIDPFIRSIESDQFCDTIYPSDLKGLGICKTAVNGILNQGFSNAFYYMFTQILRANLQFNALGTTSARNES